MAKYFYMPDEQHYQNSIQQLQLVLGLTHKTGFKYLGADSKYPHVLIICSNHKMALKCAINCTDCFRNFKNIGSQMQ